MRFYGIRDIDQLPHLATLPASVRFGMRISALVLPFRANNYVVEERIDWDAVPDDPIFRLTFPQSEMLRPEDFSRLSRLVERQGSEEILARAVESIRLSFNPHPDDQKTANVPVFEGEQVPGIQHKYAETCLVFPSSGQTCHTYCTYCFRWPQFVGVAHLKFATDEARRFERYIRSHREITDVLISGGDPMIMSARRLACYIEPLLQPEFEHVSNLRIGSKVLAYWPYRFLTDSDADDILRLFERIVASGKHLAFMAHFSHWRELATPAVCRAIARLRSTGAEIRTQAPIVRHVNDSPEVWATMWRRQVQLGCIPYYMFVARETGPHHYFAVPLARAFGVFSDAYRQVSGLCRTVRGPSMSTTAGKVNIDGIEELGGQKTFVLRFTQARDPSWCLRPFLARFDPEATWLSDLQPSGGGQEFFFERPLRDFLDAARSPAGGS